MASLSRMKATVIILDQGNTLVMDPFLAVIESQQRRFREVCKSYDISVNAFQIAEEWIKSNKKIDYPYIGHFYQEEPIVQDALRKLGVQEGTIATLAPELLLEYRIGLKNVISSDTRTQEVRKTLQELNARGKKLGVFSNDRIAGLGLTLSVMGVKSLFQYAETSESIGIEKPDPRVFEHIIAHFHIKPELLVYVGDDPIRDIEPAKKMGFKTIRYKVNIDTYNELWRDYRIRPELEPDATIEHFSELLDVIQ